MGPGSDGTPRRVLVVSADMGGGHHATGRALEESVERHWPGSEVRWIDTLDTMGSWVGPLFRRIYVANVQRTPWLYEFFYSALWRHRWFATVSKSSVAAWSGRRLATEVERFDPDLILSTYPLGSAGLSWLRRRRLLPVPVGAWVSDFAPHPFWLYRDLDATFLMHPAALPAAELTEPGIALQATVPTVERRYHPGDPQLERPELGLPADRFVVLVTCGAYGFGAVTEAVDALLAADGRIQVVVACGRNVPLRDALLARGLPGVRLLPLGWVADTAPLVRAADLVVTNAGGASALEALATGRPVVMFRPIAAHGTANAALMSLSGLAETCSTPAQLTALVSARAADGGLGGAESPAVKEYLDGHDASLDLPALAATTPPAPPPATASGRIRPVRRAWPLRPPDSFFLHVQTRSITQQVGAVITAEPEPGAPPLTAPVLVERIAAALPVLTTLRRRVVPRGGWLRPGWVVDPTVRVADHVHEVVVRSDAEQAAAIDRFWSEPVSLRRPPWQLLVVRRADTTTEPPSAGTTAEPPTAEPSSADTTTGEPLSTDTTTAGTMTGEPSSAGTMTGPSTADPTTDSPSAERAGAAPATDPTGAGGEPAGGGGCTLAFKMHHAIGDGLSLIGTLDRILETPGRRTPRRRGAPRQRSRTLRGMAFQASRVVRGMWELGTNAGAPRHPLNRELTANRRGVVTVPLPTEQVRAAARRHRVRSSEVLLGVLAEALHRAGVAAGGGAPARLRTMLPVAMASASGARTAGNQTGVVSVDLPVGPMTVTERIQRIRGDLHRRMDLGEPHAAAFVMRALGMFPAPVHAWMSQRVYNSQFFNMIASYIPGPLQQRRIAGHRLTAVYPVVALAEGVPLGIGIMRYAGVTGVCVLYDESLRTIAAPLAEAVRSAFADALAGGR